MLIALLLTGEKHKYDAVTDIELSALRLYINTGITKGIVDHSTIEKLFEGFHGQAGFKNKLTIEALAKVLEVSP